MGGANSKLFLQESVKKEKTPIILTYVKNTLDAIKTSSSVGDISILKNAEEKAQRDLNTAETNKKNNTVARDAKIDEANKKLSELKTTITELYTSHKTDFDKEYDKDTKTIKTSTDARQVAMVIAYSMSETIKLEIDKIPTIHEKKDIDLDVIKKSLNASLTASASSTPTGSAFASSQIEFLIKFNGKEGLIPHIRTIISIIKPPFVEKTIDEQFIFYMKPDEIIPKIDKLDKSIKEIPNPVEQDIASKRETLRIAQENLKKAESSERLPQLIENLDNISWTISELEPLKLKAKELLTSGPKTTGAPVAATAPPPPPGAPVAASESITTDPRIYVNFKALEAWWSTNKTNATAIKIAEEYNKKVKGWPGRIVNIIKTSLDPSIQDTLISATKSSEKGPDKLTGGARLSRRNRKTPERQSYRRPRPRGNATRKNHRPRKGE